MQRNIGKPPAKAKPMRVLIVDDHPIVASGCRALFTGDPEIFILEASDAEGGERVFIDQSPEVCVLDINLPTVSGFELARRILVRDAVARIIMFSMNDDPIFAVRAIEIGAKGYVLQDRRSSRSGRGHPRSRQRWNLFAIRDRPKHRICGTCVREKSAVEADVSRDGDIAPAQRREKSLRDRMARSFVLQDCRQYVLNDAPEAGRADIGGINATCDR
jgi:CheY-like chemotaxis protein